MKRDRPAHLPPEIGNAAQLKWLDLSGNQLTHLPPEIGNAAQLTRLDLGGNAFTTVPRCLLDWPEHTEVFLRDNPIPEAEIRAVQAELVARRAQGRAVPQLVLPPLPEDMNDLRAAADMGMNVHTQVLSQAFAKQLDGLARRFSEQLGGGSIAEQRQTQLPKVEARFWASFNAAAEPRNLANAARKVAQTMFDKAHGRRTASHNDFQYTTGHALAYAFLAMEDQVKRTMPEAARLEAQRNGMSQLIRALSDSQGFCDTRLTEEVLQVASQPLSEFAQKNPDTVGLQAPSLTPQQLRDTLWPLAQQALRQVLQAQPELGSEAKQANCIDAVREALTQTVQADHPNISPEQVKDYVKAQLVPAWESFEEMAQPPAKGDAGPA